MTTNNVGSNLQAAQDAQDAIRQNKTSAASQKKDAVKAALNQDKTSQASQKKETASNSAKPAAKVDISADAKKAAGAEGKTTEKAGATEGKKEEKAKQVNPYANAHTAQDIRKVTSQQMSKAKTATGDKQRSLRAVV